MVDYAYLDQLKIFCNHILFVIVTCEQIHPVSEKLCLYIAKWFYQIFVKGNVIAASALPLAGVTEAVLCIFGNFSFKSSMMKRPASYIL